MKYEAKNITDSFEARARVFFHNKNRAAGRPLNDYNETMMATYRDKILKTPPKHFVNVWLNVSNVLNFIQDVL